jgi:hypothetical protein
VAHPEPARGVMRQASPCTVSGAKADRPIG